jgi:hypothetical protein
VFFTDVKEALMDEEVEVGISSYLQLDIVYPTFEIIKNDAETGTVFKTSTNGKNGCRPPTSALAQLRIVWYAE